MHLFVYSPVAKTFKVEINKVPNFRLFIELVRQIWPPSLPPGV
jgi:hypothetical protein